MRVGSALKSFLKKEDLLERIILCAKNFLFVPWLLSIKITSDSSSLLKNSPKLGSSLSETTCYKEKAKIARELQEKKLHLMVKK